MMNENNRTLILHDIKRIAQAIDKLYKDVMEVTNDKTNGTTNAIVQETETITTCD